MVTTEPAAPGWYDPVAFDGAVRRHRHELHVHCYRMLGSLADADDQVQETLLRAWRHRDQLAEQSSARAWLYKIATNCCLDALERRARHSVAGRSVSDPLAELASLQPYPHASDLAGAAVARETIELTFIASLAYLPPRQRAVLIIREVLGWTAEETALVLDLNVTMVNSLLQRARGTMKRRTPEDRSQWTPARITPEEGTILRDYIEAHEHGDAAAIVRLLRDEVRITMPPERPCLGLVEAKRFFAGILGPTRPGDWRLVACNANGHPATANYLRPPGQRTFRALSIDVLRVEAGKIEEINCFLGDALFPSFGMPAEVE